LLYTYAANSATTKATYSDRGLTAANTNPVVLNSRGEAVVYGAGQYKFILRDSAGSLIWTFDYLDGIGGYLGGNFYFPDAGQADQGVAVGSVTVKDFVDAIGATKTATIVFSRGSTGNTTDYTFLNSETIPSNITCQFEQGARVSIAITKTLTLYSPANIIAQPNQQIFSGAGTIAFSGTGGKETYPQWWGAKGDNVTDDTTALQAWLNSYSNLYLPSGSYNYTTALTVPATVVNIRGAGTEYSILYPNSCIGLDFAVSSLYGPRDITGFSIDGGDNANVATGIGIRVAGTAATGDKVEGLKIHGIRIKDINTAISLRTAWDTEIWGNIFWNVYFGVRVTGQSVKTHIHNNFIYSLIGTSPGVGDSYGIYVTSTLDYDPGGVTEHRPENIQIYQNAIYGFNYGVIAPNGLFLAIESNDIDNTQTCGIQIGAITGTLNIKKNYIDIHNAVTGMYGINVVALAAATTKPAIIEGNEINTVAVAAGSKGIYIGLYQRARILNNNISGFLGYDIDVGGILGTVIVRGNNCSSVITTAIRLQSLNWTGTKAYVDGNTCVGDIYIHPTSNVAEFIVGRNNATYNAVTPIEWISGVRYGTTTRDLTLAAGLQVITGTYFTPSRIKIKAVVIGTSEISDGVSNGTNRHYCTFNNHGVAANTWSMDLARSIRLAESAGVESYATISAMIPGGFTINWSKAGAPAGTATIYYEAFQK